MTTESSLIARVSFESRAVCFIQCFRMSNDGTRYGPATATGFHWTLGNKLFLITNWHTVSGLNSETGNPIGSFTPEFLHVWFHEMAARVQNDVRSVSFVGKRVPLYEDGKPTWREHPLGKSVDVVAVPIDNYEWQDRIYTANLKHQMSDFHPMCGDDCYIVGYPEGFIGPAGTPIWKRASIATEPEMDYGEKPLFLADSLTRPGMSGAPVFARISGLWGQEGAKLNYDEAGPKVLGYWTKLLGVYSGREGDEKKGFQLSRVWKASVIQSIIENQVVPAHPHE